MKRFFLFLSTVLAAIMLFVFAPWLERTVKADSKTDTTTAIVSSSPSAVYGQPVTFTAIVTPSPPDTIVPTGDVIFNILSYGQITGQLDETGEATATLNTLQPGSYVVFATYNGDANFNASISTVITQTITHAATTTELSSSASSSVYGEPVTITATVTPVAPGEGVPTGNLIFAVSGYGSVTESLDTSGKATAIIDSIGVGNHIITATYSGDAGFYPSISSSVDLTVNEASTTTALTSDINPSDPSQSVTFTATVTAAPPGAGTPTGTAIFTIDGTDTAPVILASGAATYSIDTLASGDHTVSAEYSGDSNFNVSYSESLTQKVRTATSFSLSSSKNPSNRNDPVTFTTTGLPADATGSVTFFDGSTELGTSTISSGAAAFTVPTFTNGDHTITGQYSGDDNYASSTSSAFTQTVTTLYSYTIRYINLLTGESIAPDIQGSADLGDIITVTAPDIDGYLLQDTSDKTFTVNTGSNIETFSYLSVTAVILFLVIAELTVAVAVLVIIRILP